MKKEGNASLTYWVFSDKAHDDFEAGIKEICRCGRVGEDKPFSDPCTDVFLIAVNEVEEAINRELGNMAELSFGVDDAIFALNWGETVVRFSWDWETEFLHQFTSSDERSRMAKRLREIADKLENT